MKWDKEHLDSEDPGGISDAPYHQEHQIAESVEQFLCEIIGLDWKKYNEEI